MDYESSFSEITDLRLRVLRSIDRPIRRMSVREICSKAHISRATFYRLFSSKEEITDWWTIWCSQFYLDEIGRTLTWEEGYLGHARLVGREIDVLRIALSDGLGSYKIPIFAGGLLAQRRQSVIKETLIQYRHVVLNDKLTFIITAFVQIELMQSVEWCRHRAYSPEHYAEYIVELVPPLLYRLMQLPGGNRNR